MFCQTPEDFRVKYPQERRAIKVIAFDGADGLIHAYFQGNEDSGMMGRFVTDYVFINGWTVTFVEVSL